MVSGNNTVSNFIFYTDQSGQVKLEVLVQDESIWLTQKLMSELFEVDIRTISEHLQNIFKTKELSELSVVRNLRTTATDNKKYDTKYYNLDAIIAVGYRVNSRRATQFRIWSTSILREYIVKGFALNDERLKQGEKVFDQDYFKQLLERIRSIRSSERRIYLQITDIFAECSVDYDKDSQATKDFFSTVQNKFHYAITGQTAAEIIFNLADKTKPNMNLKTWKNSPSGRILQSDSMVAKNYLELQEIKKLERTISAFFDYIENLIENKRGFTMSEFVSSVDKFLSFNEYRVLSTKGSISQKKAEQKAMSEYKEFNKHQAIKSDFEMEIKKLQIK